MNNVGGQQIPRFKRRGNNMIQTITQEHADEQREATIDDFEDDEFEDYLDDDEEQLGQEDPGEETEWRN
jgi:hypothetical protein